VVSARQPPTHSHQPGQFRPQGIDPARQWSLVDSIINAYTRWMNVAGVGVRRPFWDFTTQTPP
jgi:hypothetical protein